MKRIIKYATVLFAVLMFGAFEASAFTIQLRDSGGNHLADENTAIVKYYQSGWLLATPLGAGDFEVTTASATLTIQMLYGGALQQVNNVPTNVPFTFNTTQVSVLFKESDGLTAISGGVVEYYASGWNSFGTTDASGVATLELLPISYSFRLGYEGAVQQISNHNVGANPLVEYQTSLITVALKTCDGTPIEGGESSFYASGWKTFGTTDINGIATKELLPVTYSFKMAHLGKSQQLSNVDVTATPTVTFNTVKVTLVHAGGISYYTNGWNTFIQPTLDMLPGSYAFKFSGVQFSLDITGCSFGGEVNLLRVLDHANNPIQGATFRGGIGANYSTWFVPGSTAANGYLLDIRPVSNVGFNYEAKVNNTTSVSGSATTNSYVFTTQLLTLRVETCLGVPIDGAAPAFGIGINSGSWWFPGGNTGSITPGESSAEVFPGTYSFRMQYKSTQEIISSWNFPADGAIVTWNTTNLTLIHTGTISYGGPNGTNTWFTKPAMELLHGTYKFVFTGAGSMDIELSGCAMVVDAVDNVPPIALAKDVYVTLVNGLASVSAQDVDNGSSDNVGIALYELSKTEFTCADIGANPVVLTVTDINGNWATANATVYVIGVIPSVAILQSEQSEFCQGGAIVLTADAPDAVLYNWSTGEATETINVYASGIYSVTITNQYGCQNTASLNIIYVPQNILSAFTMIGFKEVHLHDDNTVLNGGVGVLDANKKAKIDGNSTITAPTTFVMASDIEVKNGALVTTQILGQPTIGLPQFLYSTPGTVDITVADNVTMILNASEYKKVELNKNATVIFTEQDVSVKELKTKEGATIQFSGCTYLRVEKKLDLDKDNSFNPDGYQVMVFVENEKADIKEGTTFNGSIYTLGHEIKVKGKNTSPTYMNGFFISEKIKGEKYVTWNWNPNCDAMCPPVPASKTGKPAIAFNGDDDLQLSVMAYPSPFYNMFHVEIESDFDANIDIAIYDASGNLVEFYEDIDPLTNPDLGIGLPQGLYLVAVTQAGITKVVKISKRY